MRTSQYLIATKKETPADSEVISHQLMVRAGLIRKLASGIYTWLPLGLRVIRHVESIVREEMNNVGALEITMPMVQPSDVWEESGRWSEYGPELLRLKDRHSREFCLGPTHEEVITDLMRNELKSYKQLPVNLYQIQSKFRDEVRPRFGVMRAREFLMKDEYSFHENDTCLNQTYDIMFNAYKKIFENIGFEYKVVVADNGQIGGSESHEFHVIAENGEDELIFSDESDYAINAELFSEPPNEGDDSPDGSGKVQIKRGIEVGHIFKLGTSYSKSMNAMISNKNNENITMTMGCYGIGVSRIAAAAIEQSNDKNGIIWPKSISPFDIVLIPIGYLKNEKIREYANNIYKELIKLNFDVLLDDRDISPGIMFSDSDLIGVPYKIIIGNQYLENGSLELKERISSKTFTIHEKSDSVQVSKDTINMIKETLLEKNQ